MCWPCTPHQWHQGEGLGQAGLNTTPGLTLKFESALHQCQSAASQLVSLLPVSRPRVFQAAVQPLIDMNCHQHRVTYTVGSLVWACIHGTYAWLRGP